MPELPNPKEVDLFSTDAARSLDAMLRQLYALQTHLHRDMYRQDLSIKREDLVNLCSEVDVRILLGQHALIAQTMIKPSGGYDWSKKGVLIYAHGQDGWWRGDADLEAEVCTYKSVSLMEGKLIIGIAGEEGIVNIGRENVVIVGNPSSLLWGKEKVGIGYSLLQKQHRALHDRARITMLASIPSRFLRLLDGKGFEHYLTSIIPLSRIDERRDAVIYARSSSRMYWGVTNFTENTIRIHKSGIPPERFAAESSFERFHLQTILERQHPGYNVYLAHNEGYPRYARMQMLDALHVLHARYHAIKHYAEAMSMQRLVGIQPGERGQT